MRLTESAARAHFASVRVARLATVDANGQPHVVPMTFALSGDEIYLVIDWKPKTTRRLKRLRNIEAHPSVALLADHYDDDWSALWWVRADGRAKIIESPADAVKPMRLLAERYPQYAAAPPPGPILVVAVERWTGWAAADESGIDSS